MDESKEYIEMCRKAKELRKGWLPQKGDLTFSPRDGVSYLDDLIIGLAEMTPFGANGARIRADHIPLFRQDQLQGIAFKSREDDCWDAECLLIDFYKWIQRILDNPKITHSFEQLWLAFVMHEKYGKKWDGGDWVTAKPQQMRRREGHGQR